MDVGVQVQALAHPCHVAPRTPPTRAARTPWGEHYFMFINVQCDIHGVSSALQFLCDDKVILTACMKCWEENLPERSKDYTGKEIKVLDESIKEMQNILNEAFLKP